MNAATALRAAVISRLKADAGVRATALGPSPRVVNRVRGPLAFPYLVVACSSKPWDTSGDRGAEIELHVYVEGEFAGDEEGEAIFAAVRASLRDWAPQALSNHRLATLHFQFETVRSEEGGKRYFGDQRWRAVTEESS